VLGMIYIAAAGTSPLISDILARAGLWRWTFFMTLPFCAATAFLAGFSLRSSSDTPTTPLSCRLVNMDWAGCLVITVGSILTGLSLTHAGTTFAWRSARVLTPLILGLCFIVLAVLLGGFPSRLPMIPRSLFLNLTTVSGSVQHFLIWFLLLSAIFYIPIYYQSCKDFSLVNSGVSTLAIAIPAASGSTFAGISLTTFKAYRAHCWIAWTICFVGCGLMTMLRHDTPTSHAIIFTVILSLCSGVLSTATEHTMLAPLPIADHARALTFHAFIQAFGEMFGITIGASLLQGGIAQRLPLTDPLSLFYEILPTVHSLEEPAKVVVEAAFGDSLVAVWHAMFGVAIVGLLSSTLMKRVQHASD